MRLIEKEKDYIKIIPETLEDLWFLYNRVEGKIIEQRSLRAKKIKKGDEIIKGKKELRNIAIKVEKKRWEENKIKVIGRIVKGEERNKYHSFYLELGKESKVELDEKLPEEEKYEIFICLVNREKALLGIYKSGKIDLIKKIFAKGREEEFYKEVANLLKKEEKDILIAGYGNIKEKIAQLVNKEVFIDTVSNISEEGSKELVKRDVIKKIINKLREEKEKKLIERFLVELKRNPEKICYGSEVEKNKERIKEVLVMSDKIPKYEETLKEIENKGGKISIIDNSKEYAQEIRNFEIIGVFWW
jgi:stalled ribosome rescue protein Dom34